MSSAWLLNLAPVAALFALHALKNSKPRAFLAALWQHLFRQQLPATYLHCPCPLEGPARQQWRSWRQQEEAPMLEQLCAALSPARWTPASSKKPTQQQLSWTAEPMLLMSPEATTSPFLRGSLTNPKPAAASPPKHTASEHHLEHHEEDVHRPCLSDEGSEGGPLCDHDDDDARSPLLQPWRGLSGMPVRALFSPSAFVTAEEEEEEEVVIVHPGSAGGTPLHRRALLSPPSRKHSGNNRNNSAATTPLDYFWLRPNRIVVKSPLRLSR